MSHNMRRAIKFLNLIAGQFNLTDPEDVAKRSSLLRVVFQTKYDRAKLAKEAENVKAKHEG